MNAAHEANRHRLEVMLTEADDYDKDDKVARYRSRRAKALAKQADAAEAKAHALRTTAIEYLEGNR